MKVYLFTITDLLILFAVTFAVNDTVTSKCYEYFINYTCNMLNVQYVLRAIHYTCSKLHVQYISRAIH